jgi:hypothetical protein
MEYQDDYSFSYAFLTPGETVLWKGRPQKGHLFSSEDLFMTLFSLFWCSFAFFWEYSAIRSGAPFFFKLFGLPFIAIGLYLLVGRYFHTASLRRRTYYVVTNLKIIRKRGKKIDMLDISTMPPLQISAHNDGTGTISFTILHGSVHSGTRSGSRTVFVLENIPDVAKVHALLMTRNDH